MKQITCAQMGGPATCTAVISGNAAEELVGSGMKHVTEAHPDIANGIKAMTKEETAAWMADFRTKFNAAPEM